MCLLGINAPKNVAVHREEVFARIQSRETGRYQYGIVCLVYDLTPTRVTPHPNTGYHGRIALAGEHASFIGGWQEGAVTSALDAIGRLHQRAVAQGAKA